MRGLAMTLIGAWLFAMTGCGTVPRHPIALRPSAAGAAAVAAATPCAAVSTTTPVAQVTLGCRQLWSPYGVTAIPPSNEPALEHVPAAPPVVNMTAGAVADLTAQHWADASNWDSGWWQWAQRYDQLFMLRHLIGPALIPAVEVEALQNGGSVDQPVCNLYPLSWRLFPVGSDGAAYFARKNLPGSDAYVFVVVYSGPCSETILSSSGTSTTVVDFTRDTTVFSRGVLRADPVLGDIWFADAGGTCQDPSGPPAAWCGR
ncbi:MAG: hypothetical protein ACHQ4F_10175 [Candidatus Dormibacteria bacterium]